MKVLPLIYCSKSSAVVAKLEENGFQAFYVGGCVRDHLLGIDSQDIDVATNANLSQIKKIFPKSRIVGEAFSVALVNHIEVATFRIDGPYSDYRHPDYVKLVNVIEDDLGRRDFTVNAMAQSSDGKIFDPYNGQKDLSDRFIRFVGDAGQRLREDPIRAIRACRFVAKINGFLDQKARAAIIKDAHLLAKIAKERIQMELNKILLLDNCEQALNLIEELNLLPYILPRLALGVGVAQNHHHAEDCWVHAVKAVQAVTKKDLNLRLAVLIHDIAKPQSKTIDENGVMNFYQHDILGIEIAAEELRDLHYSNFTVEYVKEAIRFHLCPLMFEHRIKDSTIRRTLGKMRHIKIRDLLRLQIADLKGNLKNTYSSQEMLANLRYALRRIRHIEFEEHALKITDLKINGQDLQNILKIKPGPLIGQMLNLCYESVIENPEHNQRAFLISLIKGELDKL